MVLSGGIFMNMVWDRFVSNGIRELGYDVATRTMAVVFSDKTTKYHAPVTYPLYASIFHARFPERLYKQVVEGKIPVVSGS
jgi:hypothetical protein